jgi:hypothetical protein
MLASGSELLEEVTVNVTEVAPALGSYWSQYTWSDPVKVSIVTLVTFVPLSLRMAQVALELAGAFPENPFRVVPELAATDSEAATTPAARVRLNPALNMPALRGRCIVDPPVVG